MVQGVPETGFKALTVTPESVVDTIATFIGCVETQAGTPANTLPVISEGKYNVFSCPTFKYSMAKH